MKVLPILVSNVVEVGTSSMWEKLVMYIFTASIGDYLVLGWKKEARLCQSCCAKKNASLSVARPGNQENSSFGTALENSFREPGAKRSGRGCCSAPISQMVCKQTT